MAKIQKSPTKFSMQIHQMPKIIFFYHHNWCEVKKKKEKKKKEKIKGRTESQ
jgi:hypothetical protein